jgi:hypothetical protein
MNHEGAGEVDDFLDRAAFQKHINMKKVKNRKKRKRQL